MSEFIEDLAVYIRAGYPILSIVSGEEDRVLERIESLKNNPEIFPKPREQYSWSISKGLTGPDDKTVGKGDTRQPADALAAVARLEEPGVFIFKDFHPYLKDGFPSASLVVRLLRDLVGDLKRGGKTLLWVSPVLFIPPELEKDVTVIDMPLPDEEEYRRVLDELLEGVKDNPRVVIDLDDEGRDELIKACQGLTKAEAENALARTIVSRGRLDGEDVNAILAEKEQIIRKSGILEYTATVETFDHVGGLGNLKKWLKRRNEAFSQKAREFGLPNPRGVLLVGVPGCGKSLCAKAVAAAWRKPLLKFDLGRVFAGLVGESESNMRKALKVAEGVAPAVLWIDELEKGLSGAAGGGGDGGVATRVFGNLLTWMEEKEKPVFVVATANDISRLPPELLRKGRLDQIFFVDLPGPRERAEILAIHLSRRDRDPNDFDLAALVHATPEFSGAELEQIIEEGLFEAFDTEEKVLTTEHLLQAAKQTVPLARSRAKEIEKLRAWAAENCMPAALSDEEPQDDSETPPAARKVRFVDI
jgi:ATP-dependent 26S proteasome regulatory subunit